MAFSTTFREDAKEDLAHILTAHEHDERIMYWAKSGGPGRELRAIVEPDESYLEDGQRLVRIVRLEVYLSRDELNAVLLNDAATDEGGVIRPQRGDQIWRIEHDPEEYRYVHTGLVIEDNPHSYCLEFHLRRVRRTGNEHVISE